MSKLILNCPINNLGYGITSYNIYKALHKKKVDISLFTIGNIQTEDGWLTQEIHNDIVNIEKYEKDSPCLKIWHPDDLITKPHSNSIYATYSFFEVDKLHKKELFNYNNTDLVFTPTSWAKEILLNSNIDNSKIKVIPSGVDVTIFDKNIKIEENEKKDNNKYIFLNIGKWEIRKGHDLLVHLFNKAFEKHDNVELWMVNNNPFLSMLENKQWQNMYKNSKLGDKIRIFPRLPSQKHIAKLIKMSDCGIYPARAEGWNNEALETMAMNKPIILTNYSGHTQYANKNNSYLVNISKKEKADDGKFFNGYGEWASLTSDVIDQTIEYMQYVYQNNIKTNPEGLQTALKFSWNHTASEIMRHLHE